MYRIDCDSCKEQIFGPYAMITATGPPDRDIEPQQHMHYKCLMTYVTNLPVEMETGGVREFRLQAMEVPR